MLAGSSGVSRMFQRCSLPAGSGVTAAVRRGFTGFRALQGPEVSGCRSALSMGKQATEILPAVASILM